MVRKMAYVKLVEMTCSVKPRHYCSGGRTATYLRMRTSHKSAARSTQKSHWFYETSTSQDGAQHLCKRARAAHAAGPSTGTQEKAASRARCPAEGSSSHLAPEPFAGVSKI